MAFRYRMLLFGFSIFMAMSAGLLAEENGSAERLMRVGLKGIVGAEFLNYVRGEKSDLGRSSVFGVGASFEYPLLPYFFPGAYFRTQFEPFGKLISFDIDATAKLPFTVKTKEFSTDFYLLIPAGFSFARVKDSSSSLSSLPIGGNVGVFLGKDFFFHHRFGVAVDVGYSYRYLSAKTNIGKHVAIHAQELAANIGVTFRF